MSDQDSRPQPEPPAELWMLWSRVLGGWVAADEAVDGFLAAFNLHQAQRLADDQNEYYSLDCYPIKVKP